MYFLTTYRKTKGKFHQKLSILQKRDLYLNQFSNKKGSLINLRGRKGTLSGPHIPVPTFPLSTPRVFNKCGLLLNSIVKPTCHLVTLLSKLWFQLEPDLSWVLWYHAWRSTVIDQKKSVCIRDEGRLEINQFINLKKRQNYIFTYQ